MERSYSHRSQEQTQSSDALADIALNSLGLILIVLLVFVVLFSKATQSVQSQEATTVSANAIAGYQVVKEENRKLKRELDELALATENSKEGEKTSDLWRFRIAVDRFVDHRDASHPAELQIEYFVHLDMHGTQVRGTLFGVKEDPDSNENGSATHAKVSGTLEGGNMKIELFFTGAALGGSEILQVKLQGDQFTGELLSGKHKYGYQNYTGKATGTRLVGSVFDNET